MQLIKTDLINILEVKNEITLKNSAQFKELMGELLLTSSAYLVLDLSQVTYLNSSALGIIADTAMKAKKNQKELVLAGIVPPIDEIFEIVKFKTFMQLFSSLKEANHYLLNK